MRGERSSDERGLTWAEVQAHVRIRYALADQTDGEFALVWELDGDGDGAPVLQTVRARVFAAMGEPWIELVAAVEGAVDPAALFARLRADFVGALAVVGGAFVVRHTAALASLWRDDLERALEAVGVEAAHLARREPEARRAPALFETYFGAAA